MIILGRMNTSTLYLQLSMEFQSQNAGTQLGIESMCRKMAERTEGQSMRWHLSSQGIVKVDKIKANFPALYWKIAAGNNQVHCYWMPNNDEGAGQADYPRFNNSLSELVTKLEFNPMGVIKK
jgi:hypothetical protein